MLARIAYCGLVLIFCVLPMAAQDRPVHTLESLSCLPWCELDKLYREAAPGNAPSGYYRGHVVFRPCDFLAGPRERMTNFMWQGKHICGSNLINQFRGVCLIKGEVGTGESWLDGKPAHILDYQHTSKLWADVRDEAREVSPGVYIGAMYLRRCPEPKLKVMFILERSGCE